MVNIAVKRLMILLLIATAFLLLRLFLQRNHEEQISIDSEKIKLKFFAGIFSYLTFRDRRDAMRATWLQYCKKDPETVCSFLLDGLDNEGDEIAAEKMIKVEEESNLNKDMVVLETFTGFNFAYRLYKGMEYAYDKYDFDFFVRIDDDQYLCFDRLVYELPYRKKETNMIWGYMHCKENATRVDEGIMIFGRDLFDLLMERFNTLLCHKIGGQAVGLWMMELQKTKEITFFQDTRIYYELASYNENIMSKTEICHEYLSLHGAYPNEMATLHGKYENEKNTNKKPYEVIPVSKQCIYSTKVFDLHQFHHKWFAEPVPCSEKPIWNDIKVYPGREKNRIVVE